jgi:hypothetical protein
MKTYPRYFSLCLMMFLLATTFGGLWVFPNVDPTKSFWTNAKPFIGAFLMLASMIMSFVGYSIMIERTQTPETRPERSSATSSTQPAPESIRPPSS